MRHDVRDLRDHGDNERAYVTKGTHTYPNNLNHTIHVGKRRFQASTLYTLLCNIVSKVFPILSGQGFGTN